jgi:hypothetical protein
MKTLILMKTLTKLNVGVMERTYVNTVTKEFKKAVIDSGCEVKRQIKSVTSSTQNKLNCTKILF